MNKKYQRPLITVLLIMVFASSAISQNSESLNPLTGYAWNDQMVLNSLRSIHSAEMTYRNTYGNGNYASLLSLQQADLIDPVLATGQKHGYRFSLAVRFATATMQPGFEVIATPSIVRPRAISFYMNEACDIRGAERRGRDATINDPIIEPCGMSLRVENEYYATGSLRNIHGAQMTYQATYGAGQFGTPTQLYNANLTTTGFVNSYIWRGYIATFTVTPSTTTEPARFTVSIIPTQYGRTGVRSFYIDETGVLRGGDKNGAQANPSDPPVNN